MERLTTLQAEPPKLKVFDDNKISCKLLPYRLDYRETVMKVNSIRTIHVYNDQLQTVNLALQVQ